MASEQLNPDYPTPDSQAQVPVIELHDVWDRRGPCLSSSKKCDTCGWDGSIGAIFIHKIVYRQDQPECAFCEVLHRVLELVPRGDQSHPLDSVQMRGQGARTSIKLYRSGEEILLDIFRPSNGPSSQDDEWRGIPKRDIERGGTLETSLQWAKKRIHECLDLHKNCRQRLSDQEPFVPTRLVHLKPQGLDRDVRLQHGSSVPIGSKYAALSYCWGGYQPECMTESATLEENMERIPWEMLPNTFRDAVKFTRGLGLEYLWIDSICIIQDDENDWRHEAGKMFQVYRNSYITLAAVFGCDSKSGLRLHSMEEDSTLLAELRLGQRTSPLYMRPCHYLNSSERPELSKDSSFRRHHPLLYRAWTFQERMLSPRRIFFTQAEVVFQCLVHVKCQCRSVADQHTRANNDLAEYPHTLISIRHALVSNEASRALLMTGRKYSFPKSDEWRRLIVPEYSRFDITKVEDRLPALAAIAEHFQRLRPEDQYLAGLWSGSLHQDLLWKRTVGRKVFDGSSSLPTWSWAQVPGPVEFLLADDSYNVRYEDKYSAEIVDAKCTYLGDNSFTFLQTSLLRLRSNLFSCILQWENSKLHLVFHNQRCNLSYSDDEREWHSNEKRLRVAQDDDLLGGKEFILTVSLLEILGYSDNGKRFRHFLILEQLGQSSDVYTRRGILVFEYQSAGAVLQDRIAEGTAEDTFAGFIDQKCSKVTCEIQ